MNRGIKGKLVIGLAALAAAAFGGVAYAATQSSGPSTRQAFLNDVAKRLHVTPQQLTAALKGATDDQLQAAVKSGKLSQAQANALQQRLKQKGAAPVPPLGFFGPPGLAPRKVPGGPGGRFVPGAPGGLLPRLRAIPGPFALAAGAAGAASYLGMTDQQLFEQLSGGKSLAQIAKSKGKSVTGLEQAMIASTKSRLDKLVAAKLLTAAQEKQILARWQARLGQAVNQKFPHFRAMTPRFRGTLPAPPSSPKTPPKAPPAAFPAPAAPVVPAA